MAARAILEIWEDKNNKKNQNLMLGTHRIIRQIVRPISHFEILSAKPLFSDRYHDFLDVKIEFHFPGFGLHKFYIVHFKQLRFKPWWQTSVHCMDFHMGKAIANSGPRRPTLTTETIVEKVKVWWICEMSNSRYNMYSLFSCCLHDFVHHFFVVV